MLQTVQIKQTPKLVCNIEGNEPLASKTKKARVGSLLAEFKAMTNLAKQVDITMCSKTETYSSA